MRRVERGRRSVLEQLLAQQGNRFDHGASIAAANAPYAAIVKRQRGARSGGRGSYNDNALAVCFLPPIVSGLGRCKFCLRRALHRPRDAAASAAVVLIKRSVGELPLYSPSEVGAAGSGLGTGRGLRGCRG